jgi:hypothetical protein
MPDKVSRRHSRSFRAVLATLAAWLVSANPCIAIPLLLNYQGFIGGSDSLVVVSFKVYSDESGGDVLWMETHEITTQADRFSVLLGSVTPLAPDLFAGDSRYLTLSIDGQELSPRQRIVSAAYAIRAGHASDVESEDITPGSIQLSGAQASWDATGNLSTPVVRTDSLIIGSTAVIDGTGAWIGQQTGLSLGDVTSVSVDDPVVFFFNSKWIPFNQFDTFLDVPEAGKLDVTFAAQISCNNPFETRITLKQVSPTNQFLGQFGNTSGAQSSGASEGATVYNQAIIEVEPGTYRIFIEHQSGSVIEATLLSGSLIVRFYY